MSQSGATERHYAICAKDDCPWKHRGVTAEATDEAARQHVVVTGHDVRCYEEQSWTVM